MQTESESGSPLQVIQSLTQRPSIASLLTLLPLEERKDEPPGAEIPSEEPNGVQR